MKSSTFEGKPRHAWSRKHSEMNKFEGPKDNDYRQLSGVLKDMANQSFKKIKLREDGACPSFNSTCYFCVLLMNYQPLDRKF